jgi:hypothetical protein
MSGGYIAWRVLLFLCCVNATSFSQRVTIRIVDVNQTPFKNKQVYISGLSVPAASWKEEHLKLTGKPIRADLSLLTDSKGETGFDLPSPRPAYVYVRPVFSERVWDCTCLIRVPADELLQKGFIFFSSDARKKAKRSIQPKVGEVLFVMRRTPLWWQLFYPIEKG